MLRRKVLQGGLGLVALFSFTSLRAGSQDEGVRARRVVTGFQFLEGPVWLPSGILVFSDIPANRLYALRDGQTAIFRYPSGHANGNALDPRGSLLSATHDGAIVRENTNGSLQVLARSFNGKRFNSPNDVVARSDGTLYFTDPDYGLGGRPRELPFNGVYRCREGVVSLIADDFKKPNGIALSPDETRLYVADSEGPHLRVFDVARDGSTSNGRIFAELPGANYNTGVPDGMKCDRIGNVYVTGPGGVWMFDAQGKLIEKINLPEIATNLGWGGPDRRTLYITTSNSIYALERQIGGPAPIAHEPRT